MRVKISYGVEVEDVPEEVNALFTYVYHKQRALAKSVESIESLLEDEDTVASLQLMNKMRETMAEMDGRLSDLALILQGYNQFVEQQGVNNESSKIQAGGPVVATPSSNDVQGQREPDSSEAE